MKKFFTLIFLLSALLTAKSQSTTIVISQIYGGGGASTGTAPYLFDYVELHNVSSSSITMPLYSLQYGAASATSNFGGSNANRFIIPEGTIIPAGGYLLIQTAAAGTVGGPFPVTPDFITTNLTISATNGKLMLLDDTTRINCGGSIACATTPLIHQVDLVGFGTATAGAYPAFEGTASANNGTAISNRVAVVRKQGGCQDTNDNGADFDTIPNPIPRNSASPILICSNTSPVKLSLFAVQKVNSTVKISWATEQEFNSKTFVIERSANGRDWATIATLNAAGNSNSKLNYSTIDNTPGKGLNYYRLKEVDIAGRFEYSPVKQLFFSTKFQVMVSPNPVKENINIFISKNGEQASTIQLVDLNGKTVRSLSTAQSQVQMSAAGLAKGVYVVKVTDNNNVTTQKVVVQ